jgi:uncharacterized protein
MIIDEIVGYRPFIRRPVYSERVKPFMGKEIIKVITGQRRVGKSFILFQFIRDILDMLPDAHIIYLNKELKQYEYITNEDVLYRYVKENLKAGVSNFLFVDEIQDIQGWEKTLRSLLAENCCDIYCSGSNANMLSGELATFLAGRYIEIKVHSLGYNEFLNFFGLENNVTTLNAYLSMGGMPYLKTIGLEEYAVYEYLRNVYSTILLKDVVAREGIRNIRFLENLTAFLADNVGSIFSASNIAKYLKSQRDAVTTQAVLNYLKPLVAAYFIHKVPRYDIAGLRIFEVGEKYYFEDIGLRNAIRGYDKRNDIGKLMENAVYLHLIQQGFSVFTGQAGNYEIDFVAQKAGITIYIQVCYLLTDENTVNREFGNLLKINDNYRKYVVTMDEVNSGTSYQGIEQVHLKDFLVDSLGSAKR